MGTALLVGLPSECHLPVFGGPAQLLASSACLGATSEDCLPGGVLQPSWAAAGLGGSRFVNTCVFGTFLPLGCVIALGHEWPIGPHDVLPCPAAPRV